MSRRRKTNSSKRKTRLTPTPRPAAPEPVDWSAALRTLAATSPPAAAEAESQAAPDGSAGSAPPGAFGSYLARVAPEVVGVTVAFEPPPEPPVQSAVIRVHGRRLDVDGPAGRQDEFRYEETLRGVVAGSGPVTITAKVRDVPPGKWQVDVHAFSGPAEPAGAPPGQAAAPSAPLRPVPAHAVRWSWRRWSVVPIDSTPVRTGLAPLVPSPAVLLGSWIALVLTGMAVGLLTQALVIGALHLSVAHVLAVSLPALAAGAVGAKAVYMWLHRRAGRRDGWAVQGLVGGILITAALLLWLLHVPAGAYLDATAPGLMFGMATGRVGCFLTGCCAGRPTSSRWGIWSSNRTVAARRVPTQPLESALALATGAAVLAAVLTTGPHSGGLFVAAVAAYTLIRQGILLLREEPRRSRLGPIGIATIATVTLLADVAALAIAG